VAFASLEIPTVTLNQYSGFRILNCRNLIRLQKNPSLPGASDFHICHTVFIRCGSLSYFFILGLDQMSMQKSWVREILQAESYAGFHVQ
jgi:hypothetical protein